MTVRRPRANVTLTGRIGAALIRRRGGEPQSEKINVFGGGVVDIAGDRLPLTDILLKARTVGRAARQTEYLHVSDLIGKCIRKFALFESMGMPAKSQGLSLRDSITYGQGEIIHDIVKARSASGAPEMVWGNWRCLCKTTKTKEPCLLTETDREQRCPACHGPIDIYEEVPQRDESLKIVGTPDLLTWLPDVSAIHISELKSIAHDTWKDMGRPDPEHVIQVLFYWLLMSRAGYTLTNRVSIVYITKGWMFSGNPWKEYVIDAPSQIARLDVYLEEAAHMKRFREGGGLPTRICASETSTVAKKCEVCKTCFGSTNEAPIRIDIHQALGGTPSATASRVIARRRP